MCFTQWKVCWKGSTGLKRGCKDGEMVAGTGDDKRHPCSAMAKGNLEEFKSGKLL